MVCNASVTSCNLLSSVVILPPIGALYRVHYEYLVCMSREIVRNPKNSCGKLTGTIRRVTADIK